MTIDEFFVHSVRKRILKIAFSVTQSKQSWNIRVVTMLAGKMAPTTTVVVPYIAQCSA